MSTQISPRPQLFCWNLRLVWLVSLLVLAGGSALVAAPRPAWAQDARCFEAEAPGIEACISGRFREYWERNGGVAVFGYPLTAAAGADTPDGAFVTQYFERARFELHPENQPPYDVLLGRLGADTLARRGVLWADLPTEPEAAGCQHWAETQHNVCGPFLDAWRSAGIQLDDDPGLSDAESLALWGLPLSNVEPATTADGLVLIQWFERARFEQGADGVMRFGRLGAELRTAPQQSAPPAIAEPSAPAAAPAATPTPQPTPAPNVPFPLEPCNRNVPTPAEGLQLWMVDPAPRRPADAVACARLIVGGAAARGANALVYRYRGSERRPSIPQSTGRDGVASFIFYIGEEASGVRIPVEAVVTYNGVTYTAYSEFTPQ